LPLSCGGSRSARFRHTSAQSNLWIWCRSLLPHRDRPGTLSRCSIHRCAATPAIRSIAAGLQATCRATPLSSSLPWGPPQTARCSFVCASRRPPCFGVGDVSRADPAQEGVGRRYGRQIVIGPGWERAELVFELVRSPTLFVSAQLLHGAKLLEEFDTGVF